MTRGTVDPPKNPFNEDTSELRDIFAGLALNGMLSHNGTTHLGYFNPENIADTAYTLADDMLNRRARK